MSFFRIIFSKSYHPLVGLSTIDLLYSSGENLGDNPVFYRCKKETCQEGIPEHLQNHSTVPVKIRMGKDLVVEAILLEFPDYLIEPPVAGSGNQFFEKIPRSEFPAQDPPPLLFIPLEVMGMPFPFKELGMDGFRENLGAFETVGEPPSCGGFDLRSRIAQSHKAAEVTPFAHPDRDATEGGLLSPEIQIFPVSQHVQKSF